MASVEDVWGEIQRNWSIDSCPSDGVIANAEKLLRRLTISKLLPTDADRGYWPTLILVWGDEPVDVEVFDQVYELNIYPPKVAGPMFEVLEFDSSKEQSLHRLVEKLEAILK